MRKDHRIQANLFPIQLHWLVTNNALIAHALDAAPASRLRQADLLANRCRIDAGLTLQDLKNFAVYLINCQFAHDLVVFNIYGSFIMQYSRP